MKKHIPNIITSFNLLCGIIAIIFTFKGELHIAAALMALGAFFDFFDGFAARLLNVKSEMGKQMDSLADLVSFGLVPGFIMFQLLKTSSGLPVLNISGVNVIIYLAFIIPVLSTFRLAKFNIDTRQTDSFIGLPTPANSLFIGSLPFIIDGIWSVELIWLNNFYILIAISFALSILMVSELPLFALKFKGFGWKENNIRFIFLFISMLLLIIFQIAAFPLIILTYIIISLLVRNM